MQTWVRGGGLISFETSPFLPADGFRLPGKASQDLQSIFKPTRQKLVFNSCAEEEV
jgi:hypothetical protein